MRPLEHIAGQTEIEPGQGGLQRVTEAFQRQAGDAAYAMAPYVLAPDEALVITSRWPDCRFANICLWNRFLQTYDYANRPVSRNRANTTLNPDGTWTIIVAHEDPGHPNWLDTEGRPFGLVFWRYFLPTGPIDTPRAEVVPVDSLR